MAKQVAILTFENGPLGGVPVMVDAIYHMMQALGYTPTVYQAFFDDTDLTFWQRLILTFRQWKPRRVEARGLPMILVPAPPLPLWLFFWVPHFLFGPLLGRYQTVVVVAGSAHVALPLALRNKPYVLWVATVYSDEVRAKAVLGDEWAVRLLGTLTWPLIEAQERFALRKAGRVLALSYTTARRIRELVPDAAGRVETMLYPIDTSHFRPDPTARQALPYGDYLLFTARINDPRKNVPMLLQAFARVRQRFPHLKLVLAGDHPSPLLLSRVHELGLEEAVVFPGVLPPRSEELRQLYQGAQLFVLPSMQEGLGIVMLEAMACGTPVVATRCGGPEGVIIEGQTGKLVPNNDPSALAEAIVELLSQPEDRLAAMRQQCAAFVEKHCSRSVGEQQLAVALAAIQPGEHRSHIPMRGEV